MALTDNLQDYVKRHSSFAGPDGQYVSDELDKISDSIRYSNEASKAIAADLATADSNIASAESDITALQSDVTALQSAVSALNATTVGVSAYLAVSQTGVVSSTPTKINFDTEVYDIVSHFSSGTWTPPAGAIVISGNLLASGTITAGTQCSLIIVKNGSAFLQANFATVTNLGFANVSVSDRCNGSDTYELYGFVVTSAGTATFVGGANNTNFQGQWVAP